MNEGSARKSAKTVAGRLRRFVMKQEPKMIDTSKIHPSFKSRRFRYSATVNINEIKDGEKPKPKHNILSKERGRGKKWQFVGDDNGPLEYSTEAAARKDVKKLNEWAAS